MKKFIIIIFILIVSSTASNSQTADSVIWRSDSVGHSAPDTLTRLSPTSITKLYQKWTTAWSFAITADSSIEISLTANFTAGKTIRLQAGQTYSSEQLNPQTISDLYIRKYSSSSGTTNYVISAKGF